MTFKPRYLLYGLALAAIAVVLYWPDAVTETAQTPQSSALRHAVPALPLLSALADSGNAGMARDLFEVVVTGDAPPPAAPPPPVVTPPPPPPPDRFVGVKVVGVVVQNRRTSVLIESADGLQSIEEGEPFGLDQALSIGGIEGRTVVVTDSVSNVTKTFLLSEE